MSYSIASGLGIFAAILLTAGGASPLSADPFEASSSAVAAVVTTSPVAPDGTPVQCDLPVKLMMKNRGGTDGAGLCVATSIQGAARWQNVEMAFDLQAFAAKQRGGAYPAKVDQYFKDVAKLKGDDVPRYLNLETKDIEIMRVALSTGRMVSCTYSFSPSKRYGGAIIAHMVSLVHLDHKWACVADNNFVGTYEWMGIDDFKKTFAYRGNGWCVIFLVPGPAPVPIYRESSNNAP